jgi:hypothetical protein
VREFSVKGIRIELKKAGYAILMHPEFYSDHMADRFAVVYADPNKLEPYMQAYNAEEKRAYAKKGLLSARTEVTELLTVITPDGNPLPMPYVGASIDTERVSRGLFRRSAIQQVPRIGFSNGITRTFELLAQGAEYIPLEVSNESAALLHKLVGGRPAESVRNFTVSRSVALEQMRLYYKRQQAPDTNS